jgi:hypothetical protein
MVAAENRGDKEKAAIRRPGARGEQHRGHWETRVQSRAAGRFTVIADRTELFTRRRSSPDRHGAQAFQGRLAQIRLQARDGGKIPMDRLELAVVQDVGSWEMAAACSRADTA